MLGHMADTEEKTYEGGCHCGAVRWSVRMAPPPMAFAGNCSICKRAGWLLAFAPGASFQLVRGDDVLGDYQFGRKNIHHHFCKTCGIRSFSRGTDAKGEPTAAINLRCIDDLDATALPVESFDCAKM
jgi:hypothetical protein